MNPPAAELAAARRRDELIDALKACDIMSLQTRQKLVFEQGLTCVKSLSRLSDKHVKEMIDYHNQSCTGRAALHRLGYMHVRYLQALAYHARLCDAQDRPFLVAEWTREAVDKECLLDMELNSQAKALELPKLGPIRTGLDWVDWEAEWFSYTTCIPSVLSKTKGGIAYVGRRPMPYPRADATDMEKAIYLNKLHGPAFDADNQKYFVPLQSKVANTPEAEWIREFEATHVGRGAILKLREVHEGETAMRRRVSHAGPGYP